MRAPRSFGLCFVHTTNEAQLEAHRLLSSTAGARSGAARASRSPVKDTIAVNDRWGNDCRGKHGALSSQREQAAHSAL
eukprot:COSAG06_NODE_41315_length_392_cov_1.552901_1_plen_77_part_10